jgi:hypothetical protein
MERMHATGPTPMPPAPQPPPRPRSTPADGTLWGLLVVLACLTLWASGRDGSPRAGASTGDLLSWAWDTLTGGLLTFVALALAVGSVVAAATMLRGAARWAATSVSAALALGSVVALVVWYLPWLL